MDSRLIFSFFALLQKIKLANCSLALVKRYLKVLDYLSGGPCRT